MASHDLDDLMDFAVRTATAAGAITLERFEKVAVEYKRDGSEVTEADRSAEEHIRMAIAEAFPEDGIYGEEGARAPSLGDYRWVVDPIDGTRSFASGVPLYGVMLALEHRGRPIVGCAHFPALGETVVAGEGAGCWRGDRPAAVSSCEDLADARVVTSGLEYWRDWATAEGKAGFEALVSATRFARTWGDCFGYILVATGRAEVLVDPACGAQWDFAPIVPIIQESGGLFTALGGAPVRAWSSALASNGKLHAAVAQQWASTGGDAAIQVDHIYRRQGS